MNKSESIKNLAMALCKFQGEVKNPPKSADNPFFKSKYTTLDSLIDTAKPLLQKHGLSYIQSPGGDGSNITIVTLLMHESGEWIESDPLTLKADKPTAQGGGSAITYARRYALAAVLGVASDEDDDGNSASDNKSTHKLSASQVNRAFSIGKSKGFDEKYVKSLVLKKYNKTNIADLTKAEYDELCNGLENMQPKGA